MEKTRTLFNVVVLFVLVLFGSVVPASAQGVQGYEGVIQTAVVAGGTVFGVVITLLAFWWAFDRKVDNLGKKIDDTNNRLDTKIDAAKTEIKADAHAAHTAIGTNIDKVHSDIRESERRVTNNFNARFDDLRDYIKLAMNQPRDGRPSESAQDRP